MHKLIESGGREALGQNLVLFKVSSYHLSRFLLSFLWVQSCRTSVSLSPGTQKIFSLRKFLFWHAGFRASFITWEKLIWHNLGNVFSTSFFFKAYFQLLIRTGDDILMFFPISYCTFKIFAFVHVYETQCPDID
jgi:hypothetical protein